MADVLAAGTIEVIGTTVLRSSLSTTNFTRFQSASVQGTLDVLGDSQFLHSFSAKSAVLEGGLCVGAATGFQRAVCYGVLDFNKELSVGGPLHVAIEAAAGPVEVRGDAALLGGIIANMAVFETLSGDYRRRHSKSRDWVGRRVFRESLGCASEGRLFRGSSPQSRVWPPLPPSRRERNCPECGVCGRVL